MFITVLGTGTSQGVPVINCDCPICRSTNPKDKRLRSSVHIKEKETSIVIDIGPDFRTQLLTYPTPYINAVLFTHEHNDHVAGIDDLRPFVFRQSKNIPFYAQQRVLNIFNQRFEYAFSNSNYPGAPSFDAKAIEPYVPFTIFDIEVTPFSVIHGNLEILSFRLNDFVYITDAKEIPPKSIEIASNAEVLIINALREEEHWSHFNLNQCLEIIKILQPKQAYITHISHDMGFHEKVNNKLPNNIALSYDGLTINI